jgi:hypothetical protein
MSVCTSLTKLLRTTPLKLLVQFYLNFTGMISTMSRCEYRRQFPVQWFLSVTALLYFWKSASGLLLLYHICNIIETLRDWSVAQVLVHITRVFQLNDFCRAMTLQYKGSFKLIFALPATHKLVQTTPQKQLVQFNSNFTGMISIKSSWKLKT